MNDWLWYVTRATGIVATVLMLLSLAWGLLFSARETGTRLRPAWWLDLHKGLGGLALVFTVVHLVTAFADSDLGVDLATVLVPGAAEGETVVDRVYHLDRGYANIDTKLAELGAIIRRI